MTRKHKDNPVPDMLAQIVWLPHRSEDRYWNMALDEAMWWLVREGAYVALARTYDWSDQPAVSLGYFQSAHELAEQEGLCRLPFVRRPTGGGAIVHRGQLTFAFAVARPIVGLGARELACRLRSCLLSSLPETIGGKTTCQPPTDASLDRGAFLCFSRPDPTGLYVADRRVFGVAQRRSRTAVLLHGVLDLVGLCDLEETRVIMVRAINRVLAGMSVALLSDVPVDLVRTARKLLQGKYVTNEWNWLRRSPRGLEPCAALE